MNIKIDYRFTSLNEYIRAERSNRHFAADIKRDETEIARKVANGLPAVMNYPVEIVCHWFRKDRKTDPDNIEFAIKFILDGFVAAGLLKSDGWKYISEISHKFHLADNDYVVVDISQKG